MIVQTGVNPIWHSAVDGSFNNIPEDHVDVFTNSNYGAGDWSYSHINDELYCAINQYGSPANNQLWYAITNSSHFNLGKDDLGRLHMPAIMAVNTIDETYFPSMQYPRDFVYDPAGSSFDMKEVYPIAGTASDDIWFLPWDIDGNGNVNPDNEVFTYIPFAHWDQTLHENTDKDDQC
jgi:hypothetical protein